MVGANWNGRVGPDREISVIARKRWGGEMRFDMMGWVWSIANENEIPDLHLTRYFCLRDSDR